MCDGVDTNPGGVVQASVVVSLNGLDNVGGYCTTGEAPWSPAVTGGKSRRKEAHLDDQQQSQAYAPDVGIGYRTPCNSSARRYTRLELVTESAEL
jgi:hypothetical protein